MKKEIVIKTKRLLLSPMSDGRMEQLIDSTEDASLKQAYTEMLDGSKADPENRLWYTAWDILLKSDGTFIGDLCFKGPQKNASVEIGYGLSEAYWGNGYATEAARALIQWAFSQENVYFVEAETEPDNAASRRVLEKLGFQPDGVGKEGPRFVLEKPEAPWLPIYLCLGMSIGLTFGVSLGSLPLGLCFGAAFGLCLGTAMGSNEKKTRKSLREKRKK